MSDRDFAIEFTAAAALVMLHLSRFAEELILWTNPRFGFVALADRFCTGSSIMPQKKNPDVPELVRGKTGRVVGDLVALLMLMKGQPLAYNKDNQEDKEPLFDTVDTLADTLAVMTDLVAGGIRVDARANARSGARGLRDRDRPRRLPGPRACRSATRTRRWRARSATRRRRVSTSPSCRSPSCGVRAGGRRRRVRGADARGLGREPRSSGRHRAARSACAAARRRRAGEPSATTNRSLTATTRIRGDTNPMRDAKLAFLGLGVMGYPMAGHLAAAGHRRHRLQPHRGEGRALGRAARRAQRGDAGGGRRPAPTSC